MVGANGAVSALTKSVNPLAPVGFEICIEMSRPSNAGRNAASPGAGEISQRYSGARNTRRKNATSGAYRHVSHDVICNFKAAPFIHSTDQSADFYARRNAHVIARALSCPSRTRRGVSSNYGIACDPFLFFSFPFSFYGAAAVSALAIAEISGLFHERERGRLSFGHCAAASFSERST